MTGEQYSRRRFLKSGLAVTVAGLAGCSGTGATGTATPESIFQETSVLRNSLRVTLREDHDVSKVNLIAPDGSEFHSTGVETGVTTVKFNLFDFYPGQHYSPGEYELIAVRDGKELSSTSLNLQPDLRLTSIEQYSGGTDSPQNRANLLVTVENVGTAPTWVYYLGYSGTPNATHTPQEGHPKDSPLKALEMPKSKEETILAPSETQSFLGRWPPFQFSGEEHCREMTIEFGLTVYSGIGDNLTRQHRATLSGEKIQELYRETCSEISIETTEKRGTDG
ncbi:twin-arginine translocation signal domain-containing protein [Halosimplex marinum]|uniref:twin-arginine translocation signal domain-containing protein n=1 Tax=Halosimplex marinum TaxID=3396620 RepID=UPI003F57F4FC